MKLNKWVLVAILLSSSIHSRAESCLNGMPDAVRATVEQDNWTILQPQDLPDTDLKVWKNAHQGQCPGVTTGNFFPKADTSFVVALIQGDDQKKKTSPVVTIPSFEIKSGRCRSATKLP